ncbi:Solute carrier family 12 member 2 [Hondaea fermentalgiana]|uniref:Solute carrier family 12 member 2 n=1 Tax=Hondaea fermentalgiana TaxID=2315210 RepID=A0A2R5GRV7_9STRA|nr:Solute carrier family 12 member 2 [Hondaea fermentalgiana]|eukprot:GBG33039.1 Solute carrier family 12 member 2 [Hondaea fermentalgiana]
MLAGGTAKPQAEEDLRHTAALTETADVAGSSGETRVDTNHNNSQAHEASKTGNRQEFHDSGGGSSSTSVSSSTSRGVTMPNLRDRMVHHAEHKSFYEVYEENISLQKTLPSGKSVFALDGPSDPEAGGPAAAGAAGAAAALAAPKRFGTLFGVYLPCLQNILGVILFIRLPWIVGQAGTVLTTVIIMLCVLATGLTTLSMSALATNGKVGAGGPYGILLQNLGPEFAGSIGVLFYLGTTIAGTMYALGGVEAMFTSFGIQEGIFTFDRQIIAILWTLMLGSIVFAGMKWVSKVSLIFLAVVLMAVFFMTVGAFAFAAESWVPEGVLRAASASENMSSNFTADPDTGRTPNFTSLIALFFPSVTGIMAGSNRSGVLENPGRAIPKGTLGAIATTTSLYIMTTWLFGLVVANETLLSNKLVASTIAWPHQYVVAVGIIMSCVGAGLQSLAGAPQLLKSIANDGHIPFLRVFGTANPDDEPRRAVAFTTAIAAATCLAGNLDYITPIITMFFLSMYGAINLACFLSGVLRSPSFRPTWRYFHWSTALLGALVCAIMMFIISALYAFVAMLLVSCVFAYIRAYREKKEWGSALFGLRLNQAMNALLDLSDMSQDRMRRARRKRRRRIARRKALGTRDASGARGALSWLRFPGQAGDDTKGTKEAGDIEAQNDVSMLRKPDLDKYESDSLASSDEEDDLDCADLDTFSVDSPDRDDGGYMSATEENDAFLDASGGKTSEKNWRPQILVLCKLGASDGKSEGNQCDTKKKQKMRVTNPSLLRLASQLKKGRGLTIVTSVLHGDVLDAGNKIRCAKARYKLSNELVKNDVRGFTDVILGSGPNLLEPLRVLFQSKGLGMLSPNTVMLAWPRRWRAADLASGTPSERALLTSHQESYVKLLKDAIGCQKALMVVKGKAVFPEDPGQCKSTIDVWWLIHDGDMLVLLPYLLQRHRVWAGTKLRIFAIADDLVNFAASQANLRQHLQELRIEAEIEMIHVGASHARDVDQNRTVIARNAEQGRADQNCILSADMFKPLAEGEEMALGGAHSHLPHTSTLSGTSDAHMASPSKQRGPIPLIRSLSRRASLERGHLPAGGLDGETGDAVDLARVGEIAQHIRDSSGQETQRWIQGKYGSGPSPALQSLFAPMNNIQEEDGTSISEPTTGNSVDEMERVEEASATPAPVPPVREIESEEKHTGPEDDVQSPSRTTSCGRSEAGAPRGPMSNLEDPFRPELYPSYQRREIILASKSADLQRLAKRLRTATYLNEKIREHSSSADLVVLNLPLSRNTPTQEFIKYTEALTQGLPRVIMLRGHGSEHVASL